MVTKQVIYESNKPCSIMNRAYYIEITKFVIKTMLWYNKYI